MSQDEVLLLSLSYEKYTSKILSGFFNIFILPLILFDNIIIIIAVINYENLHQLSGPFALGAVSLILSLIYLLVSIIFIFLVKKYKKLDITNNTVVINDKDTYPILDIGYQYIPTTSGYSKSFVLKNKKTSKVIAYFNYSLGDTIFFKNSPEIIERILERNEPSNIENLEQEIEEDRKKVLKLTMLFEKIRVITMFLFALLVFFLISISVFRTLLISKNADIYNNIDMPPKIIYSDNILKGTVLFNEHNNTK